MKTPFVVKKINQHDDQRAMYGKKANKEEKRITAQALNRANTFICNETTGVLTSRHGTGQLGKTSTADDRHIIRAVLKSQKTTVRDISNNLHRAEGEESQSTTRYKPFISTENQETRKYRDEP